MSLFAYQEFSEKSINSYLGMFFLLEQWMISA